MLAMVALGVGEMTGSQLIGTIVDKLGSKVAVLVNIGLVASMVVVTFVYLIIYEFNWLAFVMAFLLGA
jgi:predicted MFS family arabinose efflux permease